jgi:N-acyl-D-amino-acid deacylase
VHDLVIRGGTVVDGTGLPRRKADVAVDAGKISKIGRVTGPAAREIDATGKVVAPGIVDIHTHYDPQLTFEPFATSSCFHGVTSVLAGNCGFSVAPLQAGDSEWLVQMFARVEGMDPEALRGVPFDRFETFPEFLSLVEGNLGLNAGFYLGHSTVRRFVLGDEAQQRAASPSEVEAMRAIVRSAMQAGAAGFSSSHAATHLDLAGRPVPSRLSTQEELIALVREAGESGGASVGYLPASVVTGGLDRADEDLLLELYDVSGIPIIIQGLGAKSKVDAPTEGWDDAQAFLARAGEAGASLYSMTMSKPYNRTFSLAGGTTLYEGAPRFHALFEQASTVPDRIALLRNPAFRDDVRHALDHLNTDPRKGPVLAPPTFERLFIHAATTSAVRSMMGRPLADLAADQGAHPMDVMLEAALEEDLGVEFVWRTESPTWIEGTRMAQSDPHMIIGTTDGGAHLDRDDGSEATSYFLRYWVREWGAFSLEQGINQLSAVPAEIAGFTDRGMLQAGWAADIMIFDPTAIGPDEKIFQHDFPGGAGRWTTRPTGVTHTIVNGIPIVIDGQLQPDAGRPGQVLRPHR